MTATSQAANLQAVRAALAANSAANLFTSGSPAAVITALAQECFAMLCFNLVMFFDVSQKTQS